MKIALAADHAASQEKNLVADALRDAGHEIVDFGTDGDGSVDYPDHSGPAARAVAEGSVDRAVLLCGSGIGQCIVANRFAGVRAAVLRTQDDAELSRRHNDANVACFGARFLPMDDILGLLSHWMATPFDGGRHARRVAKIDSETRVASSESTTRREPQALSA